MAGVADAFVSLIRRIVGLPEDPGAPPDLMRLGLYPARVDACSSDGKTCDVTPADTRISKGEKNVELLVGIPGSTAVVETGAIVLLGWRRGDPTAPFCMPAWTIGATVDKLVFSATDLELAGNSYHIPQFDTFETDFATAWNLLIAVLQAGTSGSPAAQQLTALAAALTNLQQFATNLTNGTYHSLHVKNG